MQFIYGILAWFASEGLGKIIRWALVSLGIGATAYFVTDSLVQSIFNYILNEFNGFSTDLVLLSGVFGIDIMFNYLLAYASLLLTYKAVSKSVEAGTK